MLGVPLTVAALLIWRPPAGCGAGIGVAVVGLLLLVLALAWLIAAGLLAVAATVSGALRWPAYLVFAVDLALIVFYSAHWVAAGDAVWAVVVTIARLLPPASLAVLVAGAFVQRSQRGVVEAVVGIILAGLLMPNFVGHGVAGDLQTGFTTPPPPQAALSSPC